MFCNYNYSPIFVTIKLKQMKVSTAKLTTQELKAIIDSQVAYLDEYYSSIDEEYHLEWLVIDLEHSFKVTFKWVYEVVECKESNPELQTNDKSLTSEDWFKIEKGFKYSTLFKYCEEMITKILKDKVNYV